MTQKERYQRLLEYFLHTQPDPSTELQHTNPYELLVAVVLSAQCTDKRVNMITPVFFQRFPDLKSLANANPSDVLEVIKSCSYPNSKTKHLIEIARRLITDYQGNIPSDPEELQKLPGIGRKTANVIISVAFGKPALAVDTHVHRVSARIGLTRNARTPLETEKQLTRYIPQEYLSRAHHWLILHGRYVCTARKPRCTECGLKEICRYFHQQVKKSAVFNTSRST